MVAYLYADKYLADMGLIKPIDKSETYPATLALLVL